MMTLLVRIEPEKQMDRWYIVGVQPTLLDPSPRGYGYPQIRRSGSVL